MWSPNPGFSAICSMASGVTLSTAIVLPGTFERVLLEIHTMTSGTDINLQASPDGVTYRRLYHSPLSATASTAITIGSAITNCHVNVAYSTLRYVKVELTTAMTATTACFKLIFS